MFSDKLACDNVVELASDPSLRRVYTHISLLFIVLNTVMIVSGRNRRIDWESKRVCAARCQVAGRRVSHMDCFCSTCRQ